MMAISKKLLLLFFIFLIVLISLTTLQNSKPTVVQNVETDVAVKNTMKDEKTTSIKGSEGVFWSNVKKLAGKINGYIDVKKVSNKLHSYIKDEVKFDNIKQIDNVISMELEELRKRKINVDIGTKISSTVVKNIASISSTEKASLNQRVFKYRNPDPEDFEKLTEKQMAVEKVTDPLLESVSCRNQVFLLILVLSKPENIERRNYIRQSWAYSYPDDIAFLKNKPKPFHDYKFATENIVKTVFIMGQSKNSAIVNKVKEESRLRKDIVFGSLQEDYRNLTMKTRLALKWAYFECQSSFVIKTDDDVFINPVKLVEWLKEMPEEHFYTGYCNSNSPVVRDKSNKWYVSYEEHKEEYYPTYCLGGGYLMSEDVLGAALKLSFGRNLFPMEDLYVGLLIKELDNVEPNDQRGHFDLIYNGRDSICEMNELFLAHQVIGQNLITHIKKAREALQKC